MTRHPVMIDMAQVAAIARAPSGMFYSLLWDGPGAEAALNRVMPGRFVIFSDEPDWKSSVPPTGRLYLADEAARVAALMTLDDDMLEPKPVDNLWAFEIRETRGPWPWEKDQAEGS